MLTAWQVLPVNHCSEQSVNQASKDLVQKHRTEFVSEKILAQVSCCFTAVQSSACSKISFVDFVFLGADSRFESFIS